MRKRNREEIDLAKARNYGGLDDLDAIELVNRGYAAYRDLSNVKATSHEMRHLLLLAVARRCPPLPAVARCYPPLLLAVTRRYLGSLAVICGCCGYVCGYVVQASIY